MPWRRRDTRRRAPLCRARPQPYRQRLELVDERRLHVARLAVDRDLRIAPERLLHEGPQLEPRQGGAQAVVAAARAEGLVLGPAAQVEGVGVVVDVLVAVGRDVPHGDLVALADLR